MDEQKIKAEAERVVEKIKALVKEGNVSRVKLNRKGETLINIPVNAGIVGALVGLSAAPFAVITAALVAFGLDCTIQIEKKDGSVTDLTKAAEVKSDDCGCSEGKEAGDCGCSEGDAAGSGCDCGSDDGNKTE